MAALLCAVAVLTAGTASAGPGPCITDPTGDVNAPTADPTADLLSVDLDSRRGRLTSTIRLAALDTAMPLVGHRYDVYVTDGERTMSLTAHADSGRGSFSLVEHSGRTDDGAFTGSARGAITGRLDAAKRSVVMSVEVKRLGLGTNRLVTVTARSWRAVGTINSAPEEGRASTYAQMDDTDQSALHRLGTPGCKR